MRHESQISVIARLECLLEAVKSLPENFGVVAADTGIGRMKIHMDSEAFEMMFAGKSVEAYGGDCQCVACEHDGIRYHAGTRLFSYVDGMVKMPSLVEQESQ